MFVAVASAALGIVRPFDSRVFERPAVCAEARGEAPRGKGFVVGTARGFVHAVRLGQRARKVERRRGGLAHDVAFLHHVGIHRFHETVPVVRRHLEKDSAVAVLHAQEEFKLEADFVEQAARLLKARHKAVTAHDSRRRRAHFAGEQERGDTHAAIHDVLAVITGIVPSAMRVPCPFAVHDAVEFQVVVHVCRGPRPLTGEFRRQLDSRSLEVERLDVRPEFAFEQIIGNFKEERFSFV